MHEDEGARRIMMSQGSRPCTEGCAAAQIGYEVTVGVTVHDKMVELRQNGVGSRQLRQQLWTIFWQICHQRSIDGPDFGGTVAFEFDKRYKIARASHKTTLGHLRFEQLKSIEHRVILEPVSA